MSAEIIAKVRELKKKVQPKQPKVCRPPSQCSAPVAVPAVGMMQGRSLAEACIGPFSRATSCCCCFYCCCMRAAPRPRLSFCPAALSALEGVVAACLRSTKCRRVACAHLAPLTGLLA